MPVIGRLRSLIDCTLDTLHAPTILRSGPRELKNLHLAGPSDFAAPVCERSRSDTLLILESRSGAGICAALLMYATGLVMCPANAREQRPAYMRTERL
jgi:hypothetical protein